MIRSTSTGVLFLLSSLGVPSFFIKVDSAGVSGVDGVDTFWVVGLLSSILSSKLNRDFLGRLISNGGCSKGVGVVSRGSSRSASDGEEAGDGLESDNLTADLMFMHPKMSAMSSTLKDKIKLN